MRKNILFYTFEYKLSCHENSAFVFMFCFNLHWEVIWPFRAFLLLYRGNQLQSIKALLYYYDMQGKTVAVKIFLYCVCQWIGMTLSWISSNNSLVYTVYKIFQMIFLFASISNGFIMSVNAQAIKWFLNLHL